MGYSFFFHPLWYGMAWHPRTLLPRHPPLQKILLFFSVFFIVFLLQNDVSPGAPLQPTKVAKQTTTILSAELILTTPAHKKTKMGRHSIFLSPAQKSLYTQYLQSIRGWCCTHFMYKNPTQTLVYFSPFQMGARVSSSSFVVFCCCCQSLLFPRTITLTHTTHINTRTRDARRV